MTPREKADRAKQLLDDPVFNAAIADVREHLVARIEASAAGDIDDQHTLSLSLQILKTIKLQLARYTDEIVLDNAAVRHESWIQRAKQRLT